MPCRPYHPAACLHPYHAMRALTCDMVDRYSTIAYTTLPLSRTQHLHYLPLFTLA